MNVNWMSTSCERQQEMVNLLVARLLSDAEKAAVEDHLTTCPACRQYQGELKALGESMVRLGEGVNSAVPSEALRARWTGEVLRTSCSSKKEACHADEAAALARWWVSWYRSGWVWGTAAAICLTIVLAVGHWRAKTEIASVPNLLQNTKLIHETLAMFPNRVHAIVQDEQGLKLVLSERENIPASAPLYVRVCDGQRCVSFVTFSGQEIQVAGHSISVLADTHGKMILVGDNFLWSDADRICPNQRWEIQTKNLGSVPM